MKGHRLERFIIPLIVCFGMVFTAYSQSFQVMGIDSIDYPTIKVDFVVKGADNKEIRTWNQGDIQVSENGIIRTGTIKCADAGQTKFSLILVLDVSFSMDSVVPGTNKTRIAILRSVAKGALKSLPSDSTRWECAIVWFNNLTGLAQDFTNDRTVLDSTINSPALDPRGGTDYNAGFLYDIYHNPGGLYAARRAKYKPVLIFLTDGYHNGPVAPPPSRTLVWRDSIIKEALDTTKKLSKLPATIFALTLGLPMTDDLNTIAKSTPSGDAFATALDQDQLNALFQQILQTIATIGYVPPCQISWLSDCQGGGPLKLTIPSMNNLEADTSFTIPGDVKPYLQVTPTTLSYPNTPRATAKTINVTITALKNNVNITNINSSNGKYTISDWGGTNPPFTLKKGTGRTIKVQYLTNDTLFSQATLNFVSDACTADTIQAHGGWAVALPFHCGSQKINTTKDVQQVTFCNNTGDPINVTSIKIFGTDQNDFSYISPPASFPVPTDTCITFEVKFTPSALGNRTATLEIDDANGNKYSNVIDGTGSGDPEIDALSSLNFPNVSCITQKDTILLHINNPGAKPLVITDAPITGTDANDFSLTRSIANMTIPVSGSDTISVMFIPTGAAGPKTATMTINSNAGANPAFPIALSGTKDSVGIDVLQNSVSQKVIDFGTICPNEDKSITLQLANTGTIQFSETASTVSPFSLPVSNWTLSPGTPTNFDIHLNTPTEGDYSQNLTFTDQCNNKLVVQLKGKVEMPKIAKVIVNLKTTVGQPKDTTFKLCNTTSQPIVLTNFVSNDASFTVISPSPIPANWTIQPGSCDSVTIQFLPTTANIVTSSITMKGTPCSFSDSVTLIGNPSLATADLVVNNTQGYVGQTIPVPINVMNQFNVIASGATGLNTTLTYDPTILQYQSTTPATTVDNTTPGTLKISNAPLPGTPGVSVTVNFQALPSTSTTSTLTLSNSTSVGGFVFFTNQSGTFTLMPSTATISLGNISAPEGQQVGLPIMLSNINNITSFNGGINTQISFDATLLEPLDKDITDLGIQNGIRTIKYNNLPVTPGTGNIIRTAQFKAMLGDSLSTVINISKTTVSTGQANFAEQAGSFSLLEVCKNGGVRLFSPTGQAAILQLSPNPTGSSLYLIYETAEEGITRISLYNLLGLKIMDIINSDVSPGIHDVTVDLSQLNSGRYVLQMQTATVTFDKWVDVTK